jgi:hypothetical protein
MAWVVPPSALVALVPDLCSYHYHQSVGKTFRRCAVQGDEPSLECFLPMGLVAMNIGEVSIFGLLLFSVSFQIELSVLVSPLMYFQILHF